jgi:hypothetical protein
MGKAADNEWAKLTATFYNNLAVGAVIAGIIIPCLTIIRFVYDVGFNDGMRGTFLKITDDQETRLLIGGGTFLLAMILASALRDRARKWANKIQD